MMLIPWLFSEQIAYTLDTVELVVVGAFDQGGQLGVDGAVGGGGGVVDFVGANANDGT